MSDCRKELDSLNAAIEDARKMKIEAATKALKSRNAFLRLSWRRFHKMAAWFERKFAEDRAEIVSGRDE